MDEQLVGRKPIQITDLAKWKRDGQRFAMLTAYDYTTACWLDQAGIPVLLVGDSLGGVMLGHRLRDGGYDTIPVTLDEVIHHAKAVARGTRRALLVGDLPFLSYHLGLDDATRSAGRLLQEGAMQAVKLEGGGPMLEVVAHLVERGIPVMGHLGLTPQSVHALGGLRVQGRGEAQAARIREALTGLEQAGAFAVVLEGIPAELAGELTAAASIPTIGIGAGAACDGQVLVVHDMLGLTVGPVPKFVKRFAALGEEMAAAASRFQAEVEAGTFPDPGHGYG
ncbi:MAG TPA: 3-methyl-2-oxobutanoate hydroxymethyltransferase [Candidatus Dormibacteraeota bacterium]|nr:3-methyl-2-oxobutanoate hydroxymethyltransferase [Candidatus Dormibacteraeota bacterium]